MKRGYKGLAATAFILAAWQAQAGEPQPPADQQGFVAGVIDTRRDYQAAPNDMARGALREKRRVRLCSALKSGKIANWVGRVSTLGSANDGRGVLAVEIGQKIFLSTTNNSFSDRNENTLLKPGTPIHDAAVKLAVGDLVLVSGQFKGDKQDCVAEMSLTLSGLMEEPRFFFRFADIRKP